MIDISVCLGGVNIKVKLFCKILTFRWRGRSLCACLSVQVLVLVCTSYHTVCGKTKTRYAVSKINFESVRVVCTCERVCYLVFPCCISQWILSGYTYAEKLTSSRSGVLRAVLRVLITVDTMRGAAIVKVETPKQTKKTDTIFLN